MMKKQIINNIIDCEQGYVNDPADSGGATKYGITEAVARQYSYRGDMRDLPRDMAEAIYADRYWHSVNADELLKLSRAVTMEVVDTGVNLGPNRAGMMLQRCLNVFNIRGKYYPDIIVDGVIGPATINALDKYLQKRDESTLVKALNCLQGSFYIELAEHREKDERFVYGWLKKRVKL